MYNDGDEEKLTLWKQKIKFYISHAEMESLNLKRSHKNMNTHDVSDCNYKMVVSAASLDHCRGIESGDSTCAKISGMGHITAYICYFLKKKEDET